MLKYDNIVKIQIDSFVIVFKIELTKLQKYIYMSCIVLDLHRMFYNFDFLVNLELQHLIFDWIEKLRSLTLTF